jgi:hypothetical protein
MLCIDNYLEILFTSRFSMYFRITGNRGKRTKFPGTKKAIKEGKYKFPYHLENYSTEVLKLAREESEDLPVNKLRIGGYTLDENTGSENIYFYYSNQRDKRLENYLEKYAVDVGQDITFKGFESTVEKYTQRDVNASISTPLLYYTETQLSFKHE